MPKKETCSVNQTWHLGDHLQISEFQAGGKQVEAFVAAMAVGEIDSRVDSVVPKKNSRAVLEELCHA